MISVFWPQSIDPALWEWVTEGQERQMDSRPQADVGTVGVGFLERSRGKLDDRGLTFAEDILHERRVHNEQRGTQDDRILRALKAVGTARDLNR